RPIAVACTASKWSRKSAHSSRLTAHSRTGPHPALGPRAESRRLSAAGLRVGEVAVVGRPNAGKSTLVNALVGERVAIAPDKPPTTGRRILGVARLPGAEIALIDTPGIHRPQYRLNAAMVREATDSLASADLVLLVVDATEAPGPGLAFIVERLAQA